MKIELLPFCQCPYPELLNDKERQIGYIRGDHDGYRWWTTWWPSHLEFLTDGCKTELNGVLNHLIAHDFPNGVPDIVAFTNHYPQAAIGDPGWGEYSFFVDGRECGYWVRLITRYRDYNLYLYGFTKTIENGGKSCER